MKLIVKKKTSHLVCYSCLGVPLKFKTLVKNERTLYLLGIKTATKTRLPYGTLRTFWGIKFYSAIRKKRTLREIEESIADNPQTFGEKLKWLACYDAVPLKTRLADKYLVKEWIAEKIGAEYVVPFFGVWDTFEEIDFNVLPEQFVLKYNKGTGANIIVAAKRRFDIERAKKFMRIWADPDYAKYTGELQHLNGTPKFIAEQYLDGDLKGYRIMCFHGKPEFIIFRGKPYMCFDVNWNPLIFKKRTKIDVPKPSDLNTMLLLATQLSQPFCFVAVDFFTLNDKIYFNEMTFTPNDGEMQTFLDLDDDLKYGQMITLPKKYKFIETAAH